MRIANQLWCELTVFRMMFIFFCKNISFDNFSGFPACSFSYKPLRLSLRFDFLAVFLANFCGVHIFGRALVYDSAISNWNSSIVWRYFMGRVIIAIFHILSIYLSKTCSIKLPLYIDRQITFDGHNRLD